jgi:3-hydroxyisobutyrate dehydrogenase-like beta-hydroxyacid dehydrogenase
LYVLDHSYAARDDWPSENKHRKDEMSLINDRTPVTVLGLGAMGTALARAFLAAGHPTTVWNRTPGKAPVGALEAAMVADSASPLVVVCLLDADSVHEVLDASGDAFIGRTLVNLTNGTPGQARTTARWAADRGIAYLDGGIMAVPPGIGTPASMVLYSGSADAFREAEPALLALGAANYVGADPGLAALFDLALLAGMYGMFAGFLHAVAMVRTEGVKAADFTEMLGPWLAAMSTSLPKLADRVDSGDHTTAVVSNLGMQATGFPNLIAASQAQGISAELLAPMGALLDRAVAAGNEDADLSVLVDLLANN